MLKPPKWKQTSRSCGYPFCFAFFEVRAIALMTEAVSTSENVGQFLPDYKAQHPRRQSSSSPNYSPQQSVLKHIQCSFLNKDRPNFTSTTVRTKQVKWYFYAMHWATTAEKVSRTARLCFTKFLLTLLTRKADNTYTWGKAKDLLLHLRIVLLYRYTRVVWSATASRVTRYLHSYRTRRKTRHVKRKIYVTL
jgi:hypothetical protein